MNATRSVRAGLRLRGYRERVQLSLRDVAQLTSSRRPTIRPNRLSRIERGILDPSAPELVALAPLYGTSVVQLARLYELEPLIDPTPIVEDDPEALYALGRSEFGAGRHARALAYFDRGIERCESSATARGATRAKHYLGVAATLRRLGRLHAAHDHVRGALAEVDRLPAELAAQAYLSDAQLHADFASFELSESSALRARARAEEAGVDRLVANACALLAGIAFQRDDLDAALALYERALRLQLGLEAEGRDCTADLVLIQAGLGRVRVELGQVVEGLQLHRDAIDRCGDAPSWHLGHARVALARSYLSRRRPRQARQQLRQVERMARGGGRSDRLLLFVACFHLHRIAASRGDDGEAQHYLGILRGLRPRLEGRRDELDAFDRQRDAQTRSSS